MRRALFASLFVLLASAPAAAQDDVGSSTQAICCGADCCFIDGSCRGRGDPNPMDACQMCDPSATQTAWSDVAGCGTDGGTTPPPDSGTTPPPDGGTTPPPDDGGCSVGGAASPAPLALIALALGLTLWRRRR